MSQTPDIVERPYLIRKNGFWYRPNCSGYTDSVISAGRYSLEEAERYTHPNGKDGPCDGMDFLHEDKIVDPDWLKFAALRSEVTDLQATIARLTRELGEARDAEAADIVAWFREDAGGTADDLRKMHKLKLLTPSQTVKWEELIEMKLAIASAIARHEHRKELSDD